MKSSICVLLAMPVVCCLQSAFGQGIELSKVIDKLQAFGTLTVVEKSYASIDAISPHLATFEAFIPEEAWGRLAKMSGSSVKDKAELLKTELQPVNLAAEVRSGMVWISPMGKNDSSTSLLETKKISITSERFYGLQNLLADLAVLFDAGLYCGGNTKDIATFLTVKLRPGMYGFSDILADTAKQNQGKNIQGWSIKTCLRKGKDGSFSRFAQIRPIIAR